jgi:hypothetical protein
MASLGATPYQQMVPASSAMHAETIEHHIAACPECKEEFEALLAALEDAG